MKNKFFGYWIVFYCFILMFLAFTVIKSLHSLFLVPVTESLGMARSEFSLVFTVTGLSLAAALPAVGKLLVKYPVKVVVSVSIFLTSAGFFAFAFARSSWQFYLIAVMVGVGSAGCTNVVVSLLINSWFIDRKGLALGIAFTGSGFGAVVFSPIMAMMLAERGWQFTYMFFGLLVGLICIPMTWLCAYRWPGDKKQQAYQTVDHLGCAQQAIEQNRGLELHAINKRPFFWAYLLAIFFCSVALGGVHLHIPAYLTDIGHTSAFVAFVYSTQAMCLIGGKILLGLIFDRRGSKAGILFLTISFCMALICFLRAQSPVLAMAFALCYGCGATFTSVGVSYLTNSFFGQRDYANIISLVNIFYVIGAAMGPLLSGTVYDYCGSYAPAWKVYIVMFLVSAIVLWLVKGQLERLEKQ